jgi:transposase-like protein
MRTDPRYTRTRDMLLDEAVPRLANGGIALCHLCQRSVYFAGGFLQAVLRSLEAIAMRTRPSGGCPRCGAAKLYFIKRHSRVRCSECRNEWSPTKGTERANAKKPQSWYDRIAELHREGHNPRRISKIIGAKDSKGVYQFVKRLQAFDNLRGIA